MNDVMPALVLGCTCFLEIAAGIALLAIAKATFSLKPHPQTTFHTLSSSTTSASSSPLPVIKMEVESTAPEEIGEVIECGACHQVIKSAPIAQAEHAETYQCEHCGANVQVPL